MTSSASSSPTISSNLEESVAQSEEKTPGWWKQQFRRLEADETSRKLKPAGSASSMHSAWTLADSMRKDADRAKIIVQAQVWMEAGHPVLATGLLSGISSGCERSIRDGFSQTVDALSKMDLVRWIPEEPPQSKNLNAMPGLIKGIATCLMREMARNRIDRESSIKAFEVIGAILGGDKKDSQEQWRTLGELCGQNVGDRVAFKKASPIQKETFAEGEPPKKNNPALDLPIWFWLGFLMNAPPKWVPWTFQETVAGLKSGERFNRDAESARESSSTAAEKEPLTDEQIATYLGNSTTGTVLALMSVMGSLAIVDETESVRTPCFGAYSEGVRSLCSNEVWQDHLRLRWLRGKHKGKGADSKASAFAAMQLSRELDGEGVSKEHFEKWLMKEMSRLEHLELEKEIAVGPHKKSRPSTVSRPADASQDAMRNKKPGGPSKAVEENTEKNQTTEPSTPAGPVPPRRRASRL